MEQSIVEGYFLGIDVGTQGTKTVLCDGRTGEVLNSARQEYPLIEKADGTREQDPACWVDAVNNTVKSVLEHSNIDKTKLRGAGVSGQQHGFVPLDRNDTVIRNAKLWNDTSTGKQCRQLIQELGGVDRVIELTGNNILPGYTAPKVLWLKQNETQIYNQLHTILLPHDYVNFYLTGEKKMEPGDASGTAFFDVRNRCWSREVLNAIDPHRDLSECLPELIEDKDPVGFIRKELLEELGLPSGQKIIVSPGGGDNMMGAIGTGNTRKGIVTVSLGTSGTIYAYSDFPVVDPRGEFAAFCDSTGGWLPLVCTMNVTVATEMVKKLFSMDNTRLEELVAGAPGGSGGLVLIPYFNGERTPNVPSGTGVYFGINEFTFNQGNLARSAMEGVTLGLRYGLEGMKKEGIGPTEIRLTGGGSKSRTWRQIASDIFNAPVVNMKIEEAASLGAALQAMWGYASFQGEGLSISEITDSLVKLNPGTRKEPRPDSAEKYHELFDLQNEVSGALRKAFEKHREIISKQ
ncbi:MAG: xylulokinase [Spirochaetota bacterium]